MMISSDEQAAHLTEAARASKEQRHVDEQARTAQHVAERDAEQAETDRLAHEAHAEEIAQLRAEAADVIACETAEGVRHG